MTNTQKQKTPYVYGLDESSISSVEAIEKKIPNLRDLPWFQG